MKNSIKTPSKLASSIIAAAFLAIGCASIGGETLAAEAPLAKSNAPSNTNALLSYPVRYSDLDTSKLQGARTLYLRIRHAAEMLCESAASWGEKEGQACVDKAINDAVVRVDRPLLSEYHQLRARGDKAGLMRLAKAN